MNQNQNKHQNRPDEHLHLYKPQVIYDNPSLTQGK